MHNDAPKHQKTPWEPSRRATARVKNPLPAPTTCPYCNGEVKIAGHDEIYGRAYGEWPWAYLCTECRAYVGMHPFTNIPLGTLANAALRKARKECKQPFEMLWQGAGWTRDQTYEGLAAHMGIEQEACHFGWFDVEHCHLARDWAVSQLRKRR